MCSIENLIVFILPVLLVFLFRRKKIDGKIGYMIVFICRIIVCNYRLNSTVCGLWLGIKHQQSVYARFVFIVDRQQK